MQNSVLTEFDDETRQLHYYLTDKDDCYYFVEYTRGRGFEYSMGNAFISNLKKSPTKHGTFEWPHKLRAIAEAAQALRRGLPKEWLSDSTFVPVPPSKAIGHPEYDDRMSQVLRQLGKGIDVRELVIQTQSMEATHVSDQRHSIDELTENYEIKEDEADPEPTHIVIVDDMVTAGAHFRAICRVLEQRFSGTPISGVFLARRVFPDENGE